MNRIIGVFLVGVLTIAANVTTVLAAELTGTLKGADGQPVAGAMVSAKNLALLKTVTVFSDGAGAFQMSDLEDGAYDLRTRLPGFADENRNAVDVQGSLREDFTLRKVGWQQAMYQIPASAWYAKVKFPSEQSRAEFAIQCAMCHQQGNVITRVPRSVAQWTAVFDKMAEMGALPTSRMREEVPAALNAAFAVNGASDVPPLPQPVTGVAAGFKITEWEVGNATSFLHDAFVGPDGRVYAVDWIRDKLFVVDPATSVQTDWDVPTGDGQPGGIMGRFASRGAAYMHHTPKVAPHSIQADERGKLWMTLSLGKGLASFDPATEEMRTFEQPAGALYAHTLRFDAKGRIWYTLAMSNHIAQFDPATGEFKLYRLPTRTWAQAALVRSLRLLLWGADFFNVTKLPNAFDPEALPIAYGIDIAPDGMVWFSQFNHRRIGRLDPETGEIRMIDTPFYGPRRMRFDSDGNLWIPSYADSSVYRFDPKTETFKRYPLPTGEGDLPYALAVSPKTGMIWITGTNSDTMIRFDPVAERFLVVPLPTRVSFTREVDFDEAGNIWTSNSNMPGWQIEGQQPRIIRLTPPAP